MENEFKIVCRKRKCSSSVTPPAYPTLISYKLKPSLQSKATMGNRPALTTTLMRVVRLHLLLLSSTRLPKPHRHQPPPDSIRKQWLHLRLPLRVSTPTPVARRHRPLLASIQRPRLHQHLQSPPLLSCRCCRLVGSVNYQCSLPVDQVLECRRLGIVSAKPEVRNSSLGNRNSLETGAAQAKPNRLAKTIETLIVVY